jgi:tRNA(Ile)-lysidine synthase
MAENATLSVRTAVQRGLADVEPGQVVLVACSGGPDSLALAAAAAFTAKREGWRAGAVIIDHQLQEDSARVAEWAASVCRRLGLDPVMVVAVEVGTEGGTESAARDARYEALRRCADESGAVAILLGHTQDDQAETVLLRLARGSGARSLAAMAPQAGLLRRPLLDLPRAVVHASARDVLDELGEQAWRDPHNDDPRFARVRVRASMTELAQALGPAVVAGLARSARLLRDDADALEGLADAVFDEHVVVEPDGCSVSVDALTPLPRAIRTRVLRRMCIQCGAPAGNLSLDHITALEQLVSAWSGQGESSLPGGVTARRSSGRVTVRASDLSDPTQE